MATLLNPVPTVPVESREVAPIISRWPHHDEDEIAAAVEVLRSGRVNALQHGSYSRAFEGAFARRCDMPHAISLANGTLALELALRALGLGPGDDVIVPARSFVASASCVVACGARPVFADVDPDTQNITATTLARALTPATRAVIAVHLAGLACPMDELGILADELGLKVVEDCAQAHGATLAGRPVGSFGDAAAFSFCTDKIMTTGGEGGMLLLRSGEAWRRAWSMKEHGKDPQLWHAPATGAGFRWLVSGFGSNYRMTELQAAIGLRQLAKLPGWVAARRRNAAALTAALEGTAAIRLVRPDDSFGHAYYRYYAFVRPAALRPSWTRDRIVGAAQEAGVPAQSGSCPEIYRERAFVRAGLAPKRPLPDAAALGRTSIALPVDPTLSEAEAAEMGRRLRAVLEDAAR